MEKQSEALQKFDASGKVLYTSVSRKLVPWLSLPAGEPDWGELLDQFFVASKHLNDLIDDMKPSFCLSIPTPCKQFPVNSFAAPQLLSTMIPSEDVSHILIKAEGTSTSNEVAAIEENNINIEEVIEKYNLQVEEWKKESKQAELERERIELKKRKADDDEKYALLEKSTRR